MCMYIYIYRTCVASVALFFERVQRPSVDVVVVEIVHVGPLLLEAFMYKREYVQIS